MKSQKYSFILCCLHVVTISLIQTQTYIVTLVHVTYKMVAIIRFHNINAPPHVCVETSDAPRTVSTSLVTNTYPGGWAQVYSHR